MKKTKGRLRRRPFDINIPLLVRRENLQNCGADLDDYLSFLLPKSTQLVHLGQGHIHPNRWSASLRAPAAPQAPSAQSLGLGWGASPLEAIQQAKKDLAGRTSAIPLSLEDLGL
jgi:hypothetical protein